MLTFNIQRASIGLAVIGLGMVCFALVLLRAVSANAGGPTLRYQHTLGARQAIELRVPGDIGAGVRVYGWDKNSLELSARVRGEDAQRVVLTHDGDASSHLRFALSGPRTVHTLLSLDATQIDVIVHAPRRAALSVSVINGAVSVDDVTGPLTVTTVNGPINVVAAGSVLSLHCTNGPVSASISDLSAVPDADITTVSGPVFVRVPSRFQAEVDVHTVVGPVDDQLPSVSGHGHLHASSTTGPVSVGYD